jgi:hypothetical protein
VKCRDGGDHAGVNDHSTNAVGVLSVIIVAVLLVIAGALQA